MVLAQRHHDHPQAQRTSRRRSRVGRSHQALKSAAAPDSRRPLQEAPPSSRMDGAEPTLKCNGCWKDLPPRTQCVAAACAHLFCTGCAEQIVLGDQSCPICQHVISKSNVKLVKVLQENPSQQLGLYGQTPEVVLNTALQAISCYVVQQKLQGDYRAAQLERKVTKVQEACRKKLEEVHNGYQLAKRKYQEAVQDKRALEQEIQELRQKYEEKARAARQLQQSLEQVQQENRLMRHGNATSGGSGGVARAGGNVFGSGGLGGLGSGGALGNHRGISPVGGIGHHAGHGGAQMVTTMQRTRVFANMTNSPQMGGAFDGLPNRNTAGLLGRRPGSGGLGGGLDASSPMAPLGRRAGAMFEPPTLQQHQQQGGSGATLRRLLVNNNHGGGGGAGAGGAPGGRRPFGSIGSPSGLVSL